jgi:hypothetical protein
MDPDSLFKGTDPRTGSASGTVPKCHGSGIPVLTSSLVHNNFIVFGFLQLLISSVPDLEPYVFLDLVP